MIRIVSSYLWKHTMNNIIKMIQYVTLCMKTDKHNSELKSTLLLLVCFLDGIFPEQESYICLS